MDTPRTVLHATVGVLSLLAGSVHLALALRHSGAPVDAAGFAVAAALQLLWGGAVAWWARPPRWLLTAGAAMHLGCTAVWGASRLVGLPIGAHAGEIQAVGALDTAVVGAQLAAAAFAALLAYSPRLGRLITTAATMLLLATLAGVVLAGPDHGHGHDHGRGHHHDHHHDEGHDPTAPSLAIPTP